MALRGQDRESSAPDALPIRVVIADDHPLIREGLARALEDEADIRVIGEASSGAEALSLLGDLEPDVLLLDVRLPDVDGIDLLRDLRERCHDAKVVMLSCVDDERSVRAAIDGGASGYLTKDTTDRWRLVTSVRDVCRGLCPISPGALTHLVDALHDHNADPLTAREREVWRLMAEGMTNAEIARTLFISERTVKFHVGNILRKSNARTRAEAVSLAFRCGLMDRSV